MAREATIKGTAIARRGVPVLRGALLLSLYSLFAVLGNPEHGSLYQSIPPTPVYAEWPGVAFWQSPMQAPALSSTSSGTGPSIQ